MKKFAYHAVTVKGETVKGILLAENLNDAIANLDASGYKIIDLKEKKERARSGISGLFSNRLKSSELLVFYFQLHDMVSAGFDLLKSLDTIQEATKNKKLKAAIHDVIERIMKGSSFSDALTYQKDIFSELFISMVRSGESSGKLSDVLGDYAVLFEGQIDLKQKVTGALIYPVMLFVVGTIVIFFLLTFAVPRFVNIFSTADVPLPLPTKLLSFVGSGLSRYWHVVAIIVVSLFLVLRRSLRTKKGKLWFDAFMLKLPVIGQLKYNVTLLLFSRTLGMLLKSGVPILHSIELTRSVVKESNISDAISQTISGLEKGKSLANMLKDTGKFPVNMVQMVAVGEQTGNLPGMLDKSSVFYDKAVAYSVRKLTIAIEPVLLVVMGLAVAFIMSSILLPLFKMIDIIKV
ncbi:MAG: type II secretion system F family protein [Candidatus Omnitrophota bacterium]